MNDLLVEALRPVQDPELHRSIVDLGMLKRADLADDGTATILVALTIAVIKATLVILYFMHVRYSSRLTQVIVAAGVFFYLPRWVNDREDRATEPARVVAERPEGAGLAASRGGAGVNRKLLPAICFRTFFLKQSDNR